MDHRISTPHRPRIQFIDEVRGFVIVLMVFYHAFFTIGWMFGQEWAKKLMWFFSPSEPFFAGVFIVLCGVSCHLSHSNWKRGLLLALVAEGISLVLWLVMPDEAIWYGVLHFLATGILLYALIGKWLDRIPFWPGLAGCVVLAVVTWWVPFYRGGSLGIPGLLAWRLPRAWGGTVWGYPLGFATDIGGDYFPLLPWIFVFLAGTFLGRLASEGKLPAWMMRSHVRPLAFAGRHALLVYVAHQPIIYGVCELIRLITG